MRGNWDLPPGCRQVDLDRAFEGRDEEREESLRDAIVEISLSPLMVLALEQESEMEMARRTR